MRITTTIGGAIAAATLAAVAATPALAAKPKQSSFLKTLAKYELGVVSVEGSTSVTGTASTSRRGPSAGARSRSR